MPAGDLSSLYVLVLVRVAALLPSAIHLVAGPLVPPGPAGKARGWP